MAMSFKPGPKAMRYGVLGLAVAGVVGLAMLAPGRNLPARDRSESSRVDGLILSGDTRSASLEAVVSRLDEMNRRHDALQARLEAQQRVRERELEATVRRLRDEIGGADAARRRAAAAELEAIRREVADLGLAVAVPNAAEVARDGAATVDPGPGAKGAPPQVLRLPSAAPDAAADAAAADAGAASGAASDDDLAPPAGRTRRERAGPEPASVVLQPAGPGPHPLTEAEVLALFRREADRLTPAALGPAAAAAPSPGSGGGAPRLIATEPTATPSRSSVGGFEIRLPATTILSGVLLTGLDAPSGAAAQINPVPVLMRLKHEAILPNNFSADVRECFVLLAAYGDLSSERANMRAEQLACVLRDGTVMQSALQAFATGEDGKAGVRGRVVTKEGAFIGRAIAVGILDGVAQAFRKSVTVSVGGGQTASDAAVAGFGGGFSGALDRIADWYLEQANAVFPVIEIDNGRAIDVVLTAGLDFRIDL